jgi:flavin-dependent dehydrogenase
LQLKSFECWSPDQHLPQKKKGKGTNAGKNEGKNGVTVTLTDGTTLEAALLIGSDGIFSTVRRQLQLPGDRLNYVGLVVVLGIVDQVPLTQRSVFSLSESDEDAKVYNIYIYIYIG